MRNFNNAHKETWVQNINTKDALPLRVLHTQGQISQFLIHLPLCRQIKSKINKLSKGVFNDSFC